MFEYKCIQCGKPCVHPWSICRDCQGKAKQEKIDYLKYLGYGIEENA